MTSNNFYKIKSTLEFRFENSNLCDISYNSLLPEFNIQKSKRSTVSLLKEEKSLIFQIESNDITAFRASINEIISFGRTIDGVLKIIDKS
jgi:tRNA threonylcarbamoyladenosine modification (KEOPS) complex  Pcc1 subunit